MWNSPVPWGVMALFCGACSPAPVASSPALPAVAIPPAGTAAASPAPVTSSRPAPSDPCTRLWADLVRVDLSDWSTVATDDPAAASWEGLWATGPLASCDLQIAVRRVDQELRIFVGGCHGSLHVQYSSLSKDSLVVEARWPASTASEAVTLRMDARDHATGHQVSDGPTERPQHETGDGRSQREVTFVRRCSAYR